jgi:hypothetical protein
MATSCPQPQFLFFYLHISVVQRCFMVILPHMHTMYLNQSQPLYHSLFAPSTLLKTISADFTVIFSYMSIKCSNHSHSPLHLLPLLLVPIPSRTCFKTLNLVTSAKSPLPHMHRFWASGHDPWGPSFCLHGNMILS